MGIPSREIVDSGGFSINCIAIPGSIYPDMANAVASKNSEENEITTAWLARVGGSHVIDPSVGVVVHFAFHYQRELFEKTDLLERYRAFAIRELQ
jgi:hypothetical protein